MSLAKREISDENMVIFFDEESKFVGIRIQQNSYKIFRTKDGSPVATLNDSYFEPVLN